MKPLRSCVVRSHDCPFPPLGSAAYQLYPDTPLQQERRSVASAWIVPGAVAGLCFREDNGLTTNNDSSFVPHVVAQAPAPVLVTPPMTLGRSLALEVADPIWHAGCPCSRTTAEQHAPGPPWLLHRADSHIAEACQTLSRRKYGMRAAGHPSRTRSGFRRIVAASGAMGWYGKHNITDRRTGLSSDQRVRSFACRSRKGST